MAKHAHDHTLHHGNDLEEQAKLALLKAGERWTDMRGSIFGVLSGFEKPASAYDIADAVSKAQGKRVAANSIYRILDLFVSNNLALRVESANAYMANPHPACVHDCIFLVCDRCGQTTHLDDDSLSNGVRAIAAGQGFVATRPVIEVRGTCAACA